MKVVAKNITGKVLQVVAFVLLALSASTQQAHASFACPSLQKSKGGADLLTLGTLTLRRDLNATENHLGIQKKGIIDEQSTGYATLQEGGAAQLVIQEDEGIYAISLMSRDTWVTTTKNHWIVVDHKGQVSCGAINESSPTITSATLNQPNLKISTNTVQVLSSSSVLKALGL